MQTTARNFGQVFLAAFSGGVKHALPVDTLPQGASPTLRIPQTPKIHPAIFSKASRGVSDQRLAAAPTHSLFSPAFTKSAVQTQVLMTGDRPAVVDTAGRAATVKTNSPTATDALLDTIFATLRDLSRDFSSELIQHSSVELAEILCTMIAASGCVLQDKESKIAAVISILQNLSNTASYADIRQSAGEVLYGLRHADWQANKVEPLSGSPWPPDKIFELSFQKNRDLGRHEREFQRKAAVAGFTGLYLSVKTGVLWVTLKNLKLKTVLNELGWMANNDTSPAVRKMAGEAVQFLTRKNNPVWAGAVQNLAQVEHFSAILRFDDPITDDQFEEYYKTEIEGPSQSDDPLVRGIVPQKCVALFHVAWVSSKLSHKAEKIKGVIEKLFVLMTDSDGQVRLNASKSVLQITNMGNTERNALRATSAKFTGDPAHDERFESEMRDIYQMSIQLNPLHRRQAVYRLWALYNMKFDLTDKDRKLEEVIYIIRALSNDKDTLVRYFAEVALKLIGRPTIQTGHTIKSDLNDEDYERYFRDEIELLSDFVIPELRKKAVANCIDLYREAKHSIRLTNKEAKLKRIIAVLEKLDTDPDPSVSLEAYVALNFEGRKVPRYF